MGEGIGGFMAISPSHKFGQIVGDTLELMLREPLQQLAQEFGLYLDHKHPRAARGNKSKVTWKDNKSNKHDLDYVLEQGGSEAVIGRPRAFIETAWRRYTKHSRNKAQEIQGAIGPLAETYSDCRPFLGVVLAGVFTEGSLAQLRSHRFEVLYYPYESVVAAFKAAGLDASFDESTSDAELQRKVDAYRSLSTRRKRRIASTLRDAHEAELAAFLDAIRRTLGRTIERIAVIPLHGTSHEMTSLAQAVNFLKDYDESRISGQFVRYEVIVRYTNGDEVRGDFKDKIGAIEFLHSLSEYRSK